MHKAACGKLKAFGSTRDAVVCKLGLQKQQVERLTSRCDNC